MNFSRFVCFAQCFFCDLETTKKKDRSKEYVLRFFFTDRNNTSWDKMGKTKSNPAAKSYFVTEEEKHFSCSYPPHNMRCSELITIEHDQTSMKATNLSI